MMPRLVVYLYLLASGLWCTPTYMRYESMAVAAVGLAAVILVQLRTTRNSIGYALACVALWAVAAVLSAPFLSVLRLLGELAGGAQ